MSPDPKVVERPTVSTPLAGDVTDFLREALAGGTGIATPLQREAGQNVSQFINAQQTPFDLTPQFDALRQIFEQQRTAGQLNLSEQFSGLGQRGGSAETLAQGRFAAEQAPREAAALSDIFRQEESNRLNRLFQGIGLQNLIGAQGFAPFTQFGQTGVVPPEVFLQQNPWVTGLQTLGSLGSAAGQAASGFGRTGGVTPGQ